MGSRSLTVLLPMNHSSISSNIPDNRQSMHLTTAGSGVAWGRVSPYTLALRPCRPPMGAQKEATMLDETLAKLETHIRQSHAIRPDDKAELLQLLTRLQPRLPLSPIPMQNMLQVCQVLPKDPCMRPYGTPKTRSSLPQPCKNFPRLSPSWRSRLRNWSAW